MQIGFCSASDRGRGAPTFGGTAGRWAPVQEQHPKPTLRSPCLLGSIQGGVPTFCHGRMPRLSRRGGRRPSTLGRAGELEDEMPPKDQAAAAETGASEAAMHDLVHEAPLLTATLLHAIASAAAGLAWTVVHGMQAGVGSRPAEQSSPIAGQIMEAADQESVQRQGTPPSSHPSRSPRQASALSPQLREFLGADTMPRCQVVKRLWQYIKQHRLQDPDDGRIIRFDSRLRKVFPGEQSSIFAIHKLLSRHMSASGELGTAAGEDHPVQSCEVAPPATPTGSEGSSEEEEKLKRRVKLLEQQEQGAKRILRVALTAARMQRVSGRSGACVPVAEASLIQLAQAVEPIVRSSLDWPPSHTDKRRGG